MTNVDYLTLTFKRAVSEGYVTNDYKVLEKGIDLLESHKVDNAIIMAAGFGSRFVPMTYEKPKGRKRQIITVY